MDRGCYGILSKFEIGHVYAPCFSITRLFQTFHNRMQCFRERNWGGPHAGRKAYSFPKLGYQREESGLIHLWKGTIGSSSLSAEMASLSLGTSFCHTNWSTKLKFSTKAKDWNNDATKVASRLLGYDFVVEYQKGRENKAADPLSRREEERIMLSISTELLHGSILFEQSMSMIHVRLTLEGPTATSSYVGPNHLRGENARPSCFSY